MQIIHVKLQQIHTPSVNRLTVSYFCSVTGYDMLASFTALICSPQGLTYRQCYGTTLFCILYMHIIHEYSDICPGFCSCLAIVMDNLRRRRDKWNNLNECILCASAGFLTLGDIYRAVEICTHILLLLF